MWATIPPPCPRTRLDTGKSPMPPPGLANPGGSIAGYFMGKSARYPRERQRARNRRKQARARGRPTLEVIKPGKRPHTVRKGPPAPLFDFEPDSSDGPTNIGFMRPLRPPGADSLDRTWARRQPAVPQLASELPPRSWAFFKFPPPRPESCSSSCAPSLSTDVHRQFLRFLGHTPGIASAPTPRE